MAGLALAATGLAVASAGSYFNPRGLYDCTAPQAATGGILYDYSFQFSAGNRYAIGVDVNYRLAGHVLSGTYRLAGNKIVGVTGPLATHHESLLIQPHDLALLDARGNFTRVGCRIRQRSGGTKTTPSSSGHGSVPLGDYSCYHTVAAPGGTYSTAFHADIKLFGDGTYQDGFSPRYSSAWHASGDTAVFTSGPLWSDISHAHDVATYHPGGVAMPHAQGTFAGQSFTLVVRDTKREGGVPPSAEFSTADDPNNSSALGMSFDYCKLTG